MFKCQNKLYLPNQFTFYTLQRDMYNYLVHHTAVPMIVMLTGQIYSG